jgi:hypothetical protein
MATCVVNSFPPLSIIEAVYFFETPTQSTLPTNFDFSALQTPGPTIIPCDGKLESLQQNSAFRITIPKALVL